MNRVHRFRIPLLGNFALTRDNGQAVNSEALFTGYLTAHRYNGFGELTGNYDLGSGLVTTAGVTLMAKDHSNATATLKLANFHDTGTGTTAPAIGQTALVTPAGGARVSGTQSDAANVYRTVATITYTSSLAITEWGLFTASTSGTMWDRRTFAAVNVVNGDSISFTYELTINAGG